LTAATGQIGPIIFEKQAEILEDHITDAINKGARVLSGGSIEKHGGGLWLKPTVISDTNHTMKIMKDESFGPLLPIAPFDSPDEAVFLANDTRFGLSAAVIGETVEQAEIVGRQINAGGVSLNDAALTAEFHEAEKHSFNESGLGGSRMGPSGFQRFLRRKALIANTGSPKVISDYSEEQ